MAQAHPDMTFDAIDHWLPLTSLVGSRDIQRDSVQGNPVSGIALAADANDDDADYAMPRDPNFCDIDVTHLSAQDHEDDSFTSDDAPSPIATITPFSPFQPIMDICKIITQNVHGLWCRSRNGDGSIIPNCERNMTKLEYLPYRMRCDDIDAWLVQETWLEDNDFDTNIGGYHMFRTNSSIGDTGHNHLSYHQGSTKRGNLPDPPSPSQLIHQVHLLVALLDSRLNPTAATIERKIKGKSLRI